MTTNAGDFHPLQERERIGVRVVAIAALVVVVGATAGVVAEWLLLRSRDHAIAPAAITAAPAGYVEFSPIWNTERGIRMQANQRAALERLEWSDRDAGIARIPIERAMDLLVDAGPGVTERP